MNKSISLLIISLLFISCETPKKSESANNYQDFPNEPSNEKKEEFQKTHTVTGEPYVSKKSIKKYKEDIDQEKLKSIVWKDLKNFKNFKVYMQTSRFNIWIDQMEDGTYRYASWSKSKTINQKPDLILENGEVTYEGSARNHWYTFKNADTKYICDINVLGKTSDDAFLIVKQGEKTVLDQSAKFLSPFTKFIPKNNVNFFLENLYSNEVNSLYYFNDKYIFTENIQNSVPLLIKTNNINDLSYIYEFPGLYESHQYDNGGKNNWHYVTIKTMKEGNGFIWENKAGVSWSLWPTTNPKVFQVAEDCPYFDVYQSVEFELDSKNNVLGIRANNEFYSVEEKIIEESEIQFSDNTLNKEIKGFLKNLDFTSFEDIIQFISGLNNGVERNKYGVSVYHPQLFSWVSNMVDEDVDLSYKKYFPYFSNELKDLLKVYYFLDEKGMDTESEKYLALVKENKDCIDYLTLNYGQEWVSEDMNVGFRGIYDRKAQVVGFWMRRHINGNSERIYELLKKIINKYEPNWSADDWIIDEVDPYDSYYEPEGCSG